jgi:hypothetical protein
VELNGQITPFELQLEGYKEELDKVPLPNRGFDVLD